MNKETAAFVRTHRNEDVRDLALHGKHDDGVDMPFALDQIAGWQTACGKLPDWAACDGIIYPPHVSMEQCSSQFTAQYKADVARRLLKECGHCETSSAGPDDPTQLVDLTGGFGVDFSYMARAFDQALYVERQPHLCELAEHNMAALGINHATIINADAETVLAGLRDSSRADEAPHMATPERTLVFLDPARRDAHGARTYAIADCTPDVLRMKDLLLEQAAQVMIKLSPMLDWRKTLADFQGAVHEVHIVSTSNECKELLLVLARGACDAPRLFCVNDDQRINLPAFEDSSADLPESVCPDLTAPSICGSYLYEPNASLMKAGCFAAIERHFGVVQIAPNSHLFVSAERVEHFPGRCFAIETASAMGKKDLRAALAGLTHANITVRNFPLSVAALRKKLKLKDGGEAYLFATTDVERRHLLIRCHKVPAANVTATDRRASAS